MAPTPLTKARMRNMTEEPLPVYIRWTVTKLPLKITRLSNVNIDFLRMISLPCAPKMLKLVPFFNFYLIKGHFNDLKYQLRDFACFLVCFVLVKSITHLQILWLACLLR